MNLKKRERFSVRKATLHDVKSIHALINEYVRRKLLLPRSLNYIYDNIRDFIICENRRKSIVACCALHVVWNNLAEIKSLAVKRRYQHCGIGSTLVKQCIKEAKALGATRVFVLTYESQFFRKMKFKRIRKMRLPAKVWRECIDCQYFPDCEEVALVKRI